MNFRGLLFATFLLYSCTPNVNNITPATNQSIKPSSSITSSPTIKPSSIPISIPSITPSITISTPSPSSTPRPTGEIKEIRVYSDDGTRLRSYQYYKMLFNETKKFRTEVIYADGVVSKEDMLWSSGNSDAIMADNSGTLKSNVNDTINSGAKINVSTKSNPSFIFSFNIMLVESLTYKEAVYNDECILTGYSDVPISRYFDRNVGISIGLSIATFSGKVYDLNGFPVSGAIVTAKGIDAGVNWVGEAQETVNGGYLFRNAPVGARIVITVTKDGWTTRTRTEVLQSNERGEPCTNIFNFGGILKAENKVYALQDEPEITSLKINGKQVVNSSNGDILINNKPKNSKPKPLQLDNSLQLTGIGNVPSLTGLNSNTLEVEMTFSEPIKVSDVKNYFRVTSQSGFDNRATSFTIDANYSGVEFLVSADEKMVTFKTNKAVLANKGGDEAIYLVDFSQPFRDKTDKAAIDRRYFRFSSSQINDFATFSVKNDETAPKLLGITATDGGSSNDTILLRYSEPMELINKASDPTGLSDPLEQTNLYRQLWYRDANDIKANSTPIANNTNDNNATLVGFLSGSDTDLNQFRASYMIGRVISSEISNATVKSVKTSILGNITRTPNTLPVKGNTAVNDLLRNVRITGSNVLLEFSPTAFDRDDRVIVSVGNRITGSFVDRNRVPSVNDDLSVSIVGAVFEYASIYDPAGRLVDSGDSTTSSNIDVNNSQRVATAS